MAQEGPAGLGAGREELCSQPLQPPPVLRGHRVPRLGLAKVQVVDAVKVHVLRVPGERGLPHAEVEVGGVDALDEHAALLL